MFSVMLMDAFQGNDTGYPTRYRFDAAMYSTLEGCMQTDVLDELLYADDIDKNASSEAKMQKAIVKWNDIS